MGNSILKRKETMKFLLVLSLFASVHAIKMAHKHKQDGDPGDPPAEDPVAEDPVAEDPPAENPVADETIEAPAFDEDAYITSMVDNNMAMFDANGDKKLTYE